MVFTGLSLRLGGSSRSIVAEMLALGEQGYRITNYPTCGTQVNDRGKQRQSSHDMS